MKHFVLLLATLALLAVLPIVGAGQTRKPSADADQWIADLDSTNFATREDARKKLLALQEEAIAPLKAALQVPNRSLLFRKRVEKIIAELNWYDAEGVAVHGLHLHLQASNDTLRPGEKLTLLTTLNNGSDFDLVIQIGWQFPGSDFHQGLTLHSIDCDDQGPQNPEHDAKRTPYQVHLRTRQSITFPTVVTLRDSVRKKGLHCLELDSGNSLFDIGPKTTIRLRMVHTVEINESTWKDFRKGRFGRATLLWSGKVRSNDVTVKIDAR